MPISTFETNTNACVYCHQGGDPETGYRRTCPACMREYLARFPHDMMDQLATTPAPQPIRSFRPIASTVQEESDIARAIIPPARPRGPQAAMEFE